MMTPIDSYVIDMGRQRLPDGQTAGRPVVRESGIPSRCA